MDDVLKVKFLPERYERGHGEGMCSGWMKLGGGRGRKIPCRRRLCNRGMEVGVARAQVVEEDDEDRR
jgi:hypothetical protein